MADPGSLHQVLMNMAVNSRDAMPMGGRFTLETANVELRAEDAAAFPEIKPGPHIRLTVSDTGIGMDEETKQRIFDPFFTTKAEGEGTGLGLSTVYGIVRQADGSVVVRSEPGKGTSFIVHLPRIADSQSIGTADPGSEKSHKGTETILVVEDQEELRKLAAFALNICGYQILEAGNGYAAMLAAQAHAGPIHLMLTDIVMPGIKGKELFDRLKAVRPEMKVLYMSGYLGDEISRRGLLEPGDMYIAKPFTPDSLAEKVRQVLGPAKADLHRNRPEMA
jgi:CheY-like chemotaxis protein